MRFDAYFLSQHFKGVTKVADKR